MTKKHLLTLFIFLLSLSLIDGCKKHKTDDTPDVPSDTPSGDPTDLTEDPIPPFTPDPVSPDTDCDPGGERDCYYSIESLTYFDSKTNSTPSFYTEDLSQFFFIDNSGSKANPSVLMAENETASSLGKELLVLRKDHNFKYGDAYWYLTENGAKISFKSFSPLCMEGSGGCKNLFVDTVRNGDITMGVEGQVPRAMYITYKVDNIGVNDTVKDDTTLDCQNRKRDRENGGHWYKALTTLGKDGIIANIAPDPNETSPTETSDKEDGVLSCLGVNTDDPLTQINKSGGYWRIVILKERKAFNTVKETAKYEMLVGNAPASTDKNVQVYTQNSAQFKTDLDALTSNAKENHVTDKFL